jgi:hypothetical protein
MERYVITLEDLEKLKLELADRMREIAASGTPTTDVASVVLEELSVDVDGVVECAGRVADAIGPMVWTLKNPIGSVFLDGFSMGMLAARLQDKMGELDA